MISYQKQHLIQKTVNSILLQANFFLTLQTENFPIQHFLYDQHKILEDVKL